MRPQEIRGTQDSQVRQALPQSLRRLAVAAGEREQVVVGTHQVRRLARLDKNDDLSRLGEGLRELLERFRADDAASAGSSGCRVATPATMVRIGLIMAASPAGVDECVLHQP